MKENIFLAAFALLVLVNCDDDKDSGFSRYNILGNKTVDPEMTGNYSLGNHTGEFTWSVSDPAIAELVSSSGSDAEVRFLRSGDVRLSVTDGKKNGYLDIIVSEGSAEAVEVYYGRSGVVSESVTDTVFFQFDSPLAEIPDLVINGTNAGDTSAFFTDEKGEALVPFFSAGQILSALEQYDNEDPTLYYALYEGGTGNGQPEAMFESIVLSDIYGGDEIENLYFMLPKVDNVDPAGTVELSKEVAKDGDKVQITVSFTEQMRAMYSTYADSLVFVHFSGGGVTTRSDTLWATNDPLVWTLEYTIDGGGDGTMTVSIGDIVDLGGNLPISLDDATITIDNTPPAPDGEVTLLPNSQGISIVTEGYWLVVESGSAAPTKLEDFNSGGSGDKVLVLEAGSYDVYFILTDEAGNESEIIVEKNIVVTE